MHNRLGIVVASTYSYRDAWSPFFELKKKFWPDCQYQTWLVTDECDEDPKMAELGIGVYRLGKDIGWAKNIAEALINIPFDYILLMQEDFFLNGKVDSAFIERALDRMDRHKDSACTRLMPCPGEDMPFDEDVGLIDGRAPYRVSCQAALWRKDDLFEILNHPDVQSPFDFEIKGTQLKPPGVFFSAYRNKKWPLPYIVSAISRGKWNPEALKMCKSLGIDIPLTYRPVEN